MALARAITRNAREHEVWIALNDLFPDSVDTIRYAFSDLLPADRIVVFSLPKLTLFRGIDDWRTRAAEMIREYALAELQPDVVHISSLFEGYVDNSVTSIKTVYPEILTAVTLYDLIPYLNPDKYLTDAGFRRHYLGKIEALKRADILLGISAYCGQEAAQELNIPCERITNISSAVSDAFKTIKFSEGERLEILERFGISRPFVMTTGIVEPRKNLEGLIVAYSRLPQNLRQQYQLLMVCQATESNSLRLRRLASSCGMALDELILAPYVTDRDLIALYNLCHLFVFPSLHEGFGLPALEAMACGAAVVGSATTSIPEVICRQDSLFDPLDTAQMAAVMQRALADDSFWRSLRGDAIERARKFSWDATGQRALSAFERAYETRCAAKEVPLGELRAPRIMIESKRESAADIRYNHLIKSLRSIGLASGETDLMSTANAIAANQRSGRVPQLFIDVSVLCEHDAKSGIQRVTRSILLQLLESPPAGWHVRPARLDRSVMAYRYANEFWRTIGVGSAAADDSDEWLDSQQGDIFLGLDLVADCVPLAEQWFANQRRRGLKIYFVVYDLLPVKHPDWFPEVIASCFPPWLKTISKVSDGLIGISRAVTDDLRVWIDTNAIERLQHLNLGFFHLGADIESSQPSKGMPLDAESTLQKLRSKPTVLMVGTVEPRKGHIQAVAAFERLWASGVEVNLAIVGKAGWRVDSFAKVLEQHPESGRRLFWLQGVSDEYLDHVYGAVSCLLTASNGEGFGLPLIEAAQKGLPIITRDLPVFREVAADHAFYFEGDSAAVLANALREWLELNAIGRAPVSSGMHWLTWAESAEQIKNVVLAGNWYQKWAPLEVGA
ncbi:glycosyltransferase family 4 protein [Paraburkholderia humisilvae]|uniref:D-inositol-3-phosphate glycosyltransferase n=1 Tax=Paraburkholderia humisilvae TaxID=627669 RepID=A0A6J5E4X4_9BURK|nr:glycosyltransferase family 1 protein [Paraburkholderia humisilvae]CAB3760132.1 D-inositol-3-phosphate glycosyltransferase [Paraburkholderia humisilvae]